MNAGSLPGCRRRGRRGTTGRLPVWLTTKLPSNLGVMAMPPARLCRVPVRTSGAGHQYDRARRTGERAYRVVRVHPAASRVDAPTEAEDVSDRCGPRTAVRCGQHPSALPSARWLTVVVVPGVAPVLLVGGWTVAAGLQPGSFNAVVSTISSLAAREATDRWVMTLALAGVGARYAVTGLARSMATTPADLPYTERSRVRIGEQGSSSRTPGLGGPGDRDFGSFGWGPEPGSKLRRLTAKPDSERVCAD